MATIKFYLQSNKNPSGIYIRLREGRNIDAKAKTKYIINPLEWSSIKQQPKNLKNEYLKKLHQDLSNFKDQLLQHYNLSVSINNTIDSKWLKDFINPSLKPDAIPTKLLNYFDHYLKHRKSLITKSTQGKYTSIKNLIDRFQKQMKIEYLIKDVNADFKLNFEQYCKSQNYSQNTIARAMRFIKTICYHARNNGIETHFQLNSIKTKNEKVEKIFLTVDEINQIQMKELPLDHLDNARDWLIISCETGQRISDFLNFKKEIIRYEKVEKLGQIINVPLIEFTQVKTQKKMSIPLSKRVLDILNKRDGEFPRKISDQHYNQYIKDVCEKVGMVKEIYGSKVDQVTKIKVKGNYPKYQLVTSHIGRRSFATNNYGKIPTSLLMNATGHSTEKMFLEYIGKTETEKAKQLAEYFI